MWSSFRAIAARIGLTREQVETVESGGAPTQVQDPRDPQVEYYVRPDPDWTQRLNEAWCGTLKKSRREWAGVVPVPDGRMRVAPLMEHEQGITIAIPPGEYEFFVTIAHEGAKRSADYAEHVSHVWGVLRGRGDAELIEPMTDERGAELQIDSKGIAFAGTDALERIAAACPYGRIIIVSDLLRLPTANGDATRRLWARAETDEGSGALVAVSGGYARQAYTVSRIADPQGATIGILIDFYVDNRPYRIPRAPRRARIADVP